MYAVIVRVGRPEPADPSKMRRVFAGAYLGHPVAQRSGGQVRIESLDDAVYLFSLLQREPRDRTPLEWDNSIVLVSPTEVTERGD